MKGKKLIAQVTLIVFAIVLALSGCGGQSAQESTGTGTVSSAVATAETTAENPVKDPIEISIALWDIEKAFPAGDKSDAVYDLIKEKFNITIKPFNITWDDADQKIQVWASSGQLPDITAAAAIWQPFYKKWIDEKLVKALPDDLSNFPNIKKIIDLPDVQSSFKYTDGKFYAIPRVAKIIPHNKGVEKALYLRKDWLDQAGITTMPQNTDEFITMVKKVMDSKPEGKNIIGITAHDPGHMYDIFMSLCPSIIGGAAQWIKVDGKWTPSLFTREALTGIKEFKRMYDAGIIDKDYSLVTGEEGVDKFASGKAFGLFNSGIPLVANQIYQKLKLTYPDKKFGELVIMPVPWPASDGKTYRFDSLSYWSESYFNNNMDDKKLDRILMLYDWLLSPDGVNTMFYGIKDKDYKVEDGKIIILRPKNDKGEYDRIQDIYPVTEASYLASWNEDIDMTNPSYPEDILKQVSDNIEWAKTASVVDWSCKPDFLEYPAKEKTSVLAPQDEITKIILDKKNDVDTAFDKMVDNMMKAGYKDIIDQVNEQMAKLGQ